ncbi:PIN domain-containing protein [Plasmodiophora brassicae]|uniref:Uncharacterized protein n=1 Tax=Plasmodiophora brassicae TaxID=37360 RepID=A0A0G4IJC7_PLABS|nr:hypothetical protein PBRA_004107 [Plasmodiophora brassicae]SPQ96209.1 unnamed protein product [Plasmodiophora brassicae]
MSAPAATAAAAAAPARLYVDALNFGGQFVSRDHWKLSEITDNVGLFVGAAKRSSIELKVFIDETIRTGDALQKWQRRREREVRTGRRNVPHGMSELVGDAFRQAGVDVHYSEELDNDDTLASFAQADGAAILSADRDFFDYRDSTFDVYDDFNVTASRALELRPARAKGPQRNCKALVLDRYPQTKTTPQRVHAGTTVYRRGAPSGLVRLAGNPHITVRPLRQALYHDVGIRSPVIEVFPYWDDAADCVKWTDEAVPPDGSLSHLLTTPKDAVKHFFGRDLRPAGVSWLDWNNHLFSVHAIVAELCVERMRPTSLLDIMNEFVRSRLVADDVSDRLASLASLAISSQPVYKFTCAACQAFQRLKQSEVDWFTSRRLELPKTCKSCRSKNGRRRHKGRT